MADDNKPSEPSAPPTGANPAATPQHRPVPGGDAPATAAAAAATGATPTAPAPAAPGAHAVKPAAPRPAPAPIPDLAGKTTNAASVGARTAAAPAKAAAATRDPDDTSPLFTRRAWMGLAWGAFSAATAAALAATGRF